VNALQTFAAHWPAEPPRAELRATILAVHRENGVELPEGALDEVVDIACHAAVEARSAFLRVLGSSRIAVGLTALGPAAALLRHDLDFLQSATTDVGQQVGARTVTTTLERTAHG
jgi:hypothetical protein